MDTELHRFLIFFIHFYSSSSFSLGTCIFLHRLHSKMDDCCRRRCTSYPFTHTHPASCPSVSRALELLRRSSSLMATELLLSSIPSPASTPSYRSLLTSYAAANPRIPKLSGIFLLRNPCHSRDLKQNRIRSQQKRNTALLLHGYRRGGVVEASAEELAVQVSGQEEEEEVARVKFNDGSTISFAPILNGCWTLAGGHGVISEPRILETMELYAAHGLTTFDTADIYGPSEAILGKFREQWENRKRNQSGGNVHHQMQDLQVCDPSTYKPWEIGLRL